MGLEMRFLFVCLGLLRVIVSISFDDPLFPLQWHLHNEGGNDLNVLPVWQMGLTGKGVGVCLIDDGVDFEHDDLKDSFPSRDLQDWHGTRCAGLIAAKPNNSVCGVGIAHGAYTSAIKILGKRIQSENEAAAVTYKMQENHIYNCSWGPADDGRSMDAPDKRVLSAFVDGLLEGRRGFGSIYVFAAGNGGRDDNCNYDGYANNPFSITVGALDHKDNVPKYSEACPAQLISAYSSNRTIKISTTDLGDSSCTFSHGGTSAAAPMVSGIVALLLEAYPSLDWRQVQNILVYAAVPIQGDLAVVKNAAGLFFSKYFGFGKIDAARTLGVAATGIEKTHPEVVSLPTITVKKSILAQSTLTDYAGVEPNMCSSLRALEHVTVTISLRHRKRGDLEFVLCSGQKTCVQLASERPNDRSSKGLRAWTMSTVAFWGERPSGKWVLKIRNHGSHRGIMIDWRLSLWGPLREGILWDPLTYKEKFINTYYPPNSTHFTDPGFWKTSSSFSISRTKTLGTSFILFVMIFLVVFAVFGYFQIRSGFNILPSTGDALINQREFELESLN